MERGGYTKLLAGEEGLMFDRGFENVPKKVVFDKKRGGEKMERKGGGLRPSQKLWILTLSN